MIPSEFRPHCSMTVHHMEELLLFHYFYMAFWKVAVLNRDPTILLLLELQNELSTHHPTPALVMSAPHYPSIAFSSAGDEPKRFFDLSL